MTAGSKYLKFQGTGERKLKTKNSCEGSSEITSYATFPSENVRS